MLENSTEEIVDKILENGSKVLSSAILSALVGVSPVVCREIAYRCVSDDIQTELLSPDKIETLKEQIDLIRSIINENKPTPYAVFDADLKPLDFSFFPITQYGSQREGREYESFSQLLDGFCFEKDRQLRIKNRAGDLLKMLSNTRERILRKINLQHTQLEKCADKEQLKIYAELISSNLYRLEKGAAFYDLENYYDSGKSVRIPVNPALTPVQNSQKYYKEYRKSVTAEKLLGDLIENSEQELSYIDSVLDSLSRADTEADIAEIRQELVLQGYIRHRKKDKVKLPKTLPPYEFKTSEGFRVLVGRNNIQNDKLTFKTAKNYDMWLHTQKFAGSHTIIVSDNREITDKAIEEAASIAAAFSSASDAYKVPVDYTLVKNLKKPPNSKPGKVIYHVYNTIYVEPFKQERGQ